MPRTRFGPFEFDPASRELSRQGVPIRLQPQPARILDVLLQRPGEIVAREELRQAVWTEGTHVDFERGLNFCIAQIRSALGDSAESPRYIETLPKRGYRFVAAVQRVEHQAEPQVSDVRAAAGASGGRARQATRNLALIALVTVVGAVLASRTPGDSRIRVGVLPFDNETGLNAYSDLAQGIADATVARLAAPGRVERLAVVGNSAALRRPRAFRDISAIAEAAGVEYVVLAQVKRDDSRVRLIAHLIRTRDEAHVWAETFDRDVFTLDAQAEIAEAIAGAVAARLADSE